MSSTIRTGKTAMDEVQIKKVFLLSMAILAVLLPICIGCGNSQTGTGRGSTFGPGYSGMALLKDNLFVVVYDTKYKRSAKKEPPRVGMVMVEPVENGDILVDETEVKVKWGTHRPSNDLEAICGIPGNENEFLLAESGDKPQYGIEGKIYHVKVFRQKGKKKWRAEILGRIDMPDSIGEIEGIACLKINSEKTHTGTNDMGGKYLVILGYRGGKTCLDGKYSTRNKPGRILWGTVCLDYREPGNGKNENNTEILLKISGDVPFEATEIGLDSRGDVRSCSDLLVDDDHRLWISAALDGGDRGPFRSVIYLAGRIDTNDEQMPVKLLDKPMVYWTGKENKIEAIGPPPTFAGTLDALNSKSPGLMSIGSDDEDLGSIWKLALLKKQ